MVFNSITFLLFFVVFFILYWFVCNKNLKQQNFLVLVGSYVFYAWIDWRFLFFLISVSLLNFLLGIYIEKKTTYNKLLVCIGLLQGIGTLIFFKYYDFFITSFRAVFSTNSHLQPLHLIIPLGISFFTFRTISYVLDVNKGKLKATKDWVVFFSYVSFFPSLLSGPIDKAIAFIPQLETKRIFDYNQAIDGLRQILWGLFKKAVIANNCAMITSLIFDNYQTVPASSLLLGAFLYTIEIYADFSGYSDMAIGLSRLIGFNITQNFNFPFFAQNIAEFWRKWHISLTAWLTEYVFTPLSIAFRDYDKMGLILAILINFSIIGLWHGANWTYILFGFLHGCYYIPLIIKGTMNKKKKLAKDKIFPSFKEFINMVGTFILVMLTFILFKSDSIAEAYHYYSRLFSTSVFTIPTVPYTKVNQVLPLLFIPIMFCIEWIGREKQHAIATLEVKWNKPVRWAFYYFIIIAIFCFSGMAQQFIYFQF